MPANLEYESRRRLKWKRDGAGWILWCGRRRMGHVVPDSQWPAMYRSMKSGGALSDMARLSWAKDAVLGQAVRELEWSARHDAAQTPSKCPEKGGSKSSRSSSIRQNELPAT